MRTTGGEIQGGFTGEDEQTRVFKGIPYAALPVGENRWREPQSLPSWEGVKQTTEFSPQCRQPVLQHVIYGQDEPPPQSEDCLYLNIWTAAEHTNEARPVMVWIHGGAFFLGSGSLPLYDGEALAQSGVVLVTINYRLGAFGFFAHPALVGESPTGSAGNQGIHDQVAALAWVQDNIRAFGGNPAYYYVFAHAPPVPELGRELGAFHGGEIQYAFGNDAGNWDEVDKRVSELMLGYWVNFAKTGDPNEEGLPLWSAYDKGQGNALWIDADPREIKHYRQAKLDVYENWLSF